MVPVAQGVAWDVIVRMGETEAELCFFERNTLVILLYLTNGLFPSARTAPGMSWDLS